MNAFVVCPAPHAAACVGKESADLMMADSQCLSARRYAEAVGFALVAVLGGVVTYFAYPPHYYWGAGIVGIAFLFLTWHRISLVKHSRAFIWGSFAGGGWAWGLFFPMFVWIKTFVGAFPWIVLVVAISLFYAVNGVLAVFAFRTWGFVSWRSPLVVALWWTTLEIARAHFPFGGFAWGSPAFAQALSPLGAAATWGSTTAVTFLTVMAGYLVSVVVAAAVIPRFGASIVARRSMRVLATYLMVFTVMCSSSALYESWLARNDDVAPTRTVAYIQGNVVAEGITFNAIRREILRNHAATTVLFAAKVREGIYPQPDIVVWPENSADVDPFADAEAYALLTQAARAIKAPILVGAVLGRQTQATELNAVLVWTDRGYGGQRHVKRHIQPFGEYLPFRPVVEKLSPYAAYAGNFGRGNGPGVIEVSQSTVGVATCFEVVFDDSGRRSINNGAQWLAVPSNNATFGMSNETYQQLGITQFRARELHRWAVVAATSGTSAFVNPQGVVLEETPLYEQGYAVRSIPMLDVRPLSTVVQPWLDGIVCLAAVVCLAESVFSRSRRRMGV